MILVRHGQSEGNVVELSETGREQAAAVGRWLSELADDDRPGIVWTSPYRRARQTGEIALETAEMPLDFPVDERLRDRDTGITDMLTGAGIRNRYPGEAERRAPSTTPTPTDPAPTTPPATGTPSPSGPPVRGPIIETDVVTPIS